MVTERSLTVPDAEGMAGSVIPYLEYGGTSDGPDVCLIAGVHGCEYSSMLGLRRFLAGLDESQVRGRLTAVPVANLASFEARQAFTVPHDDLNLNRCFPGRPDGSFTERLAWVLFDTLIRRSTHFVDMHCGDQVEALAPFALYDASAVEGESRQMALDYGLGFVIRSERSESPIAGTSSAAAAEVGVPAITAEVGGRGIVEEDAAAAHVAGLRRLLGRIGLLPDTVPAAPAPEEMQRFVWLSSPKYGWWEPAVAVGEEVAAGQSLGTVGSLLGGDETPVVAPDPGVPLFITSSPAVIDGGLLLGLGVR